MNWRDRLAKFMIGRYGADALSRGMVILAIALYILNLFLDISLISGISFVLIFLCYYRMFSRNVYKRANENQTYLQKTAKLRLALTHYARYFKTLKTHHIYKCPKCNQKIRIPRGKGKILIHCPKCGTDFTKRS